jgi:DNA topoisomerase IB
MHHHINAEPTRLREELDYRPCCRSREGGATCLCERVASRLGNTPTICRKCYVDPEILAADLDGDQMSRLKQDVQKELANPAALYPEEAAI